MHILYVEDEAKIADFVCQDLKEQGFVVDHQSNGEDGYLYAIENTYDAIVFLITFIGAIRLAVVRLRALG